MFARRTAWKLAPNRYSQALSDARLHGTKLLDLTASNPTQCKFDFDSKAILQSLAHPAALSYDPQPQGLLVAREAVADYYNRHSVRGSATPIGAEQIFLTTSTSEGYSYLFRLLCDSGDEVLVPRPSYPLFEFLADIHDVPLRPYDLFYDHGWHIDTGGISAAVSDRTRAVLVVNPNNPTGSFVHAQELEKLAALCAEHELALIADEVFLDYVIDDSAVLSLAFANQCLAFTLSGLSKISCLPQMKLAWIVLSGPEEVRKAAHERLGIIADTYLSANAPIQHAARELLSQKDYMQPQLLRRIRSNLKFLDEEVRNADAIQRLRVEGGWYAVLRVPVKQSDEDLAIELIGRGVIIHPGHFYDFLGDGFLVVSLITPDQEFSEGMRVVLNMFDSSSSIR